MYSTITNEPAGCARTLVILIPAYNEATNITGAIQALPTALSGVETTRIIVIDDGSSDDTAELAEAAGAEVIRHSVNLGLASAFRTGIRRALEHRADVAVSIDADRQFSADDLPDLVDPILRDRADFVAGDRFHGERRPPNMPATKYFGNRLMTRLINTLTGRRFSDVSSGYRAYGREALLNLNIHSSFTYTQESFLDLCAKQLRIEQVPVSVRYHSERESAISGNLLRYATRTILTIGRATRDYAPFRVFGLIAAALMLPGLGAGIFVFLHYIATGSFSPYIFLAFTAAYLVTLGFGLLVLALLADVLRGIRSNQERLLYLQKWQMYYSRNSE